MNAHVIVNRLLEVNDGIRAILQSFVALNLKDAPRFKVENRVSCNDVDRIGGPSEHLPVAVVSYDTMQKYIVPRNGGFLVPVPVEGNWTIYSLTPEQLRQVIETLAGNAEASLADFYRLASETGTFWRNYY